MEEKNHAQTIENVWIKINDILLPASSSLNYSSFEPISLLSYGDYFIQKMEAPLLVVKKRSYEHGNI